MDKIKDTDLMPYGKYKGVALINVPASYLLFMYNSDQLSEELTRYVEDNWDVINKEFFGDKK